MTAIEKMLWDRNQELISEIRKLDDALALVLISKSHKEAVKAAHGAIVRDDPFDPFNDSKPVTVTQEVRKTA